jgi:hypothetical protein
MSSMPVNSPVVKKTNMREILFEEEKKIKKKSTNLFHCCLHPTANEPLESPIDQDFVYQLHAKHLLLSIKNNKI